MEKHRCKLCSRTFANGRALGGHMKGHLAALPLPPKPSSRTKTQQLAESASSWSSSSQEEQEEKCLIYTLRENRKKSVKLADPEFSAAAVLAVQDRESETESRNPTRKRSKRTRKSAFLKQQQQQQPMMKKQSLTRTESQSPPVSSISDASPEEDVAMCLIMLSRDKWATKQENNNAEKGPQGEIVVKKFECEKCKKKFRSSKALAGHRAVHSRAKDSEADEKDKIFECPFCFKVFGSGQSLGGHKRSHLLGQHANGNASAAAAASSSSTAMMNNNSTTDEVKTMNTVLIDLNLPAPVEEDDEYSVVSQAEC